MSEFDHAEPILTPPLAVISANPSKPERLNYLTMCLASLRDKLRFRGQAVERYIIAEDPACGLEQYFLRRCEAYETPHERLPGRRAPSLGVSLNYAFAKFADRPILYVQDDYELVEPLDLAQDIDYLSSSFLTGCVRYMRCDSLVLGEIDWHYRWIDSNYFPYYSHSPHLRRPKLHGYAGPFDEYQDHFQTEVAMSRRMAEQPHRIVLRQKDYFRNLGQVSSLA